MSSIKNMLPEEGHVIRDGHLVDLNAADIVPGDVIRVKAGNKLPADIRLIEASSDVKFDRSVLTGESKPVAGTVDHTDTNYLETHNIGLQGTHCILGSCTGIVVATGDRTVFGRIASLTNEPKVQMTTLEKEVLYFVIIIASIMISMIAVVCIIWYVPSTTLPFRYDTDILQQGRVSEKEASRLHQRANPHRQLCQRRHRFHPRRSSHLHHRWSHHHRQFDEEEQDSLQVPQDCRDTWVRFGRLL